MEMVPSAFTRRRFLAALGIGTVGVAAASACVTLPTNAPAATPHPADHGETGSAGAGAADMDAKHEAKIKAFPAATKGKGGQPMPFRMEGDRKVFEVTCQMADWEVEPGKVVKAMTYNGTMPGPEIRVTEGDKVRVVVKNELPESTAIHWHGLYTDNLADGVPGVTQPPIKPGETYIYEFTAAPVGSHMYHSHHDAATQVTAGLLGAFIVEPKDRSKLPKYDSEYTLILNDGSHGFTLNGKAFPATEPLKMRMGETLLIRYMNEGLMAHPMHLHGMPMEVIAKDGYPLPNPYLCDTQFIAPGDRYDVLVRPVNPGTWAFHCHILNHAESAEGMFGMVTVLVVEPAAGAAAPTLPYVCKLDRETA
jgi:FtsP/CotA-like multicopper oxidase with cupredoxin domain